MGLSILIYRFAQKIILQYFSTTYSIQAETAIFTVRDINLTPDVLVFFGIAILIMSLSLTAIALTYSREKNYGKHGILNIFLYMFLYLLIYPILMIVSIYKFLFGKSFKW